MWREKALVNGGLKGKRNGYENLIENGEAKLLDDLRI